MLPTALELSNNILDKGFEEKIPITPMKLQRLLYLFYRDYIKRTGIGIFREEFECWERGTVVPSVYHYFSFYEYHPIEKYYRDVDDRKVTVDEEKAPENFILALRKTWSKYKYTDANTLSNITMQEGNAWDKAVKDSNSLGILLDRDIMEDVEYG